MVPLYYGEIIKNIMVQSVINHCLKIGVYKKKTVWKLGNSNDQNCGLVLVIYVAKKVSIGSKTDIKYGDAKLLCIRFPTAGKKFSNG